MANFIPQLPRELSTILALLFTRRLLFLVVSYYTSANNGLAALRKCWRICMCFVAHAVGVAARAAETVEHIVFSSNTRQGIFFSRSSGGAGISISFE